MSDSEIEMRWNQFAYRLGVMSGQLDSILIDPVMRDDFVKKGGDPKRLEWLQELATKVAEFFYRD
jgi:hypothetical protein